MNKILFIALIFLFGCTSGWQSSSEVAELASYNVNDILNEKVPRNLSYLYVFKKSGFQGSFAAWPIQLDQTKVGMIKNGGFMLIKTTPGEHFLYPEEHVMGSIGKGLSINVKGGKRYFYEDALDNIISGDYTITAVEKDYALKLIGGYKLNGIYKGKSSEVVSSGEACKYWTPKKGITDEEKAWKEIRKNLITLKKETENFLKVKPKSVYPSVKIKGREIPFDKVFTTITVLNKVNVGDFKGAAEDTASELISYLVPVAGQYKALLDATKTSIDAVLKNWTESIYLMPAYQTLEQMIIDEVKRGMKLKRPYYASGLLSKGSLYKSMFNRERAIYLNWKQTREFREDFNESAHGKENMARLRQILGHQPIPVEIYSSFYKKIIKKNKGYIEVNYHRITEDLMHDEMNNVKPKVINSVCSKLYKQLQKK